MSFFEIEPMGARHYGGISVGGMRGMGAKHKAAAAVNPWFKHLASVRGLTGMTGKQLMKEARDTYQPKVRVAKPRVARVAKPRVARVARVAKPRAKRAKMVSIVASRKALINRAKKLNSAGHRITRAQISQLDKVLSSMGLGVYEMDDECDDDYDDEGNEEMDGGAWYDDVIGIAEKLAPIAKMFM